ncbi:MAG: hypothetical protein WCP14_02125 [bacterium]
MKERLKKIDWRIIAITVGIALVTAGAIGFGVWYYMDQQNQKLADDNDKQVELLQKRITKLEKSTVNPTPTLTPTPTPTTGNVVERDLNEALIANGTYTVGDKTFKMINGVYTEGTDKYEFETPLSSSRSSLLTDGKTVAAVIKKNTGGTGFFKYLVILESQGGEAKSVANISLGDRVQIKSVDLKTGDGGSIKKVVTVSMVDFGKDDPSCCPTVNTTKTFNLSSNNQITQFYEGE